MSDVKIEKVGVLVIGAGPAGLAAAIAAREAGCDDVLVLERDDAPGGILQQCIHPGFGLHRFREELTGPEYAARFIEQARELEIPVRCRTMVLDVTRGRRVTMLSADRGVEILDADAIILAMGCRERARGALMIPGARPAGVYSAGTAQRLVNLEGLMPGRRIVILGSGDIGLIMARRMTCQGAKVLACVELMPYSSGLKRNIVQCLDDFDIPLLLSHTVTRIDGRERVEGVIVSAVGSDCTPIPGTERLFECDTLLLSCGLLPENELSLRAGVPLSPVTGGAVVDDALETEVSGIFACGNVLHVHDLVDHVSDEAEIAGRAAARWAAAQAESAMTELEGIQSKIEEEATTIVDGNGVRGCVPHKVRAEGAEEMIALSFRPSGVFKKAAWRIRAGDRVLFSRKALILTPGESQSVEIPRVAFAGVDEAVVEVVTEEAK
ncbi:MAG: NAD(P)/FAD-dependent oxidoreductase [Kiritimatiellia bacterium]|jgi:NADPH-dependent 2,4-dienoyl-CoA reductase/sulfur reductase-like enzyme